MAGKPKDARQPYSVEQVDRIVNAVRLPVDEAKRAYLHRELNTVAGVYLSSRDDLTPAKVRDRLAAIEKASQELLSAFRNVNVKETGQPPVQVYLEMFTSVVIQLEITADEEESEEGQPITQSGTIRVREAIRGIFSLQRWATRALAQVKEFDVKRRGRTKNISQRWFLAGLARIYYVTFQRKPGVSRSPATNRPGGPFFRFVRSCLEELGERYSLETVAKLARRGKKYDYEIDWDIGITDGKGRVLFSRPPWQ